MITGSVEPSTSLVLNATNTDLTGDIVGPGTVTVASGAQLTMDSSSGLAGGVRLVNNGDTEVQMGDEGGCYPVQGFAGGSVLENAGTLSMSDGANLGECSDGNPANQVINDSGASITYGGSSQGQSASISLPLEDTGSVQVAQGTLEIAEVTPNGDPSFAGPGTASVDTVTINGTQSVSGTWTLTGPVAGPGSLTVTSGSQFTMGYASGLTNGVRLVNDGTTDVQMGDNGGCYSGEGLQGGSVLENAGSLVMSDNAIFGECSDSTVANQVVNDVGATISYSGSKAALSSSISVPVVDAGAIIVPQGTLDIAAVTPNVSPTFVGPGTTSIGTVNIVGAQTMSGPWTLTGDLTGPGTVTLASGSQLTMGYASGLQGGVRLVNKGTTQVQMGDNGGCYSGEGLYGGSVLENAGTLVMVDNAVLGQCSDSSTANQVVNDAGATISYGGSKAASSAAISVPVQDAGAIQVSQGTLNISVGVGSGSPTFSGAGTVDITGTASLPSGTSMSGLKQLQITGSVAPQTSVVLNAASTSLTGDLTGPGTVTLASGSQLTMGYASGLQGGVRLVNKGTTQVQMGDNGGCYSGEGLYGGSVLENAGTLVMVDNAVLGQCSDSSTANQVVNDAGATISYGGSKAASSAAISVPVQDAGAIQVSQGTLNISVGVGSGSPTFSGAGTVDITGTASLPSGTSMSGLKQLQITGSVAPQTSVVLNAASTSLTGDLTGPGTVTLASGSQLTMGYASGLQGGVRLVNKGTTQVQMGDNGGCYSGEGLYGGSVLENAGTLVMVDNAVLGQCSDSSTANQVVNDAGATISYGGSKAASSAAISVPVQDAGAIQVSQGTLNISVGVGSGSPTFSGAGTVDITGTASLPSGTSMSGLKQLQITGSVAPQTSVVLNAASTSLTGDLTGPGTVTLASGSQLTMGYASGLQGGVRLVNKGTTQVQMGDNGGCYSGEGLYGGSVLENAGTLVMVDNAVLGQCSDSSTANQVVNDAGATISYGGSKAASSAAISVPVQDAGAIQVSQGTLNISAVTPTGSPTISGQGTVAVGTVAIFGSQTMSGPWTLDGAVSGTGTLTLAAGSQLTMGYASGLQGGVRLVNKGTIQVQMGDNGGCYSTEGLYGGSVLENAGVLDMSDNADLGQCSDTSTANEVLDDGSGTIAYSGSTPTSQSLISLPLQLEGSMQVPQGTLNLPDFVPSTGSTLTLGVGPAGSGQIATSGVAQLSGTLTLTNVSGYVPAVGTQVTLVTASSVNGTFSSVTGTQLNGVHWVISYTPTNVVATAVTG